MGSEYNIGDIVLQHWTLVRWLGEGSFGRVFEAERKEFGTLYKSAIKIITIPQNQSEVRSVRANGMDEESITAYFRSFVEELVNEFALMSRLKGTANVVNYHDHVVIKHEGAIGWDIIIRMELLTTLSDYASQEPFTQDKTIKLGIDICHALELCQKFNIVHRDVKPENIFVSELGDFKLGDFGISRIVEKTTSGLSRKGTYNYMPPEVYRGEAYSPNVDMYSLGLVLYGFLNDNRTPFLPEYPAPITYNQQSEAREKRIRGVQLPPPKHASDRLAEIILKACAFDPKDRYSSPIEMRQELEELLYKNPVSTHITHISPSQPKINSYMESNIQNPEVISTQKNDIPIFPSTESANMNKTNPPLKKSKMKVEFVALGATAIVLVFILHFVLPYGLGGLFRNTSNSPQTVYSNISNNRPPSSSVEDTFEYVPAVTTAPVVGDIIQFGNYDWRVLEIKDDRVFLLSEHVITRRQFFSDLYDEYEWRELHDRYGGYWGSSSIRRWLNNDFYYSFTPSDRNRIMMTTVHSSARSSTIATVDRVFLLNENDIVEYFGWHENIEDITPYLTAYDINGVATLWWLSSPGAGSGEVSSVGSGLFGGHLATSYNGVRPALWMYIGETPPTQVVWTFYTRGGRWDNGSSRPYSVIANEGVIPSAPMEVTRQGFNFLGWSRYGNTFSAEWDNITTPAPTRIPIVSDFQPLIFNSPEVEYTMNVSFIRLNYQELTDEHIGEMFPLLDVPITRATVGAHPNGSLGYILFTSLSLHSPRIRVGIGELRTESTVYGFNRKIPLEISYVHGIPVTVLMLLRSGVSLSTPYYFQAEFMMDNIMFRIVFYKDSLRDGQLQMTEIVNQIILGGIPDLSFLYGLGIQ